MKNLKINILTIFPNMFSSLKEGLIGKALQKNLWTLNIINLTHFKYKGKIDDRPFGGGEGMVILPTVLEDAINTINNKTNFFFMSPRGQVFNQQKALQMSKLEEITLICGRYEGIDQRIIDYYGIQELSIGDFILCGGEVAASLIIESIVRLLPETLHNRFSVKNESFDNIILEHSHYTQKRIWNNISAPEYLKTGHDYLIWSKRFEESIEITKKNRPDLFKEYLFWLWLKIFLVYFIT